MTTNLILIVVITLGTIALTVIRGLVNLPNASTKKEKKARLAFKIIAGSVICLNIFLGVRTYISQTKEPYKLNRQQISFSIKLNCDHCAESDVDSLTLPSHFTVNNIYLGSSTLSCDFNRIETPIRISGPRSAGSQIYYRSSYISFENKKSAEEYIWDLNGGTVSLSLPGAFNQIFDSTRRQGFAWWSGQLIVELDKSSIGEGQLNKKETYHDHPKFYFPLNGLSKKEVEKKYE